LWDTFISSGLTSAEPGWLNRELALKDWTLYYTQKQPVITNPCGEIWLEEFGNCCLGHLVIPRFIKDGVLDFDLLGEVVRLGVRFLDNILSVNTFPLPEMKKNAEEVRRVGLGKTGLADAMAMLGLRYGSKEALVFQDDLEHYITKVAYDESVLLAVEKGPFPLCVPDLHAKSGFTKKLSNKIRKRIAEHGIRNCALITQAPTGTVSILSGNCSSGIEPIFAPAYERRYRVDDETRTETVIHPLVLQFHEEGKDVSCFVGSHEVSPRDHLAVQATSQYWTDNSVSKTINLPESCTENELSEALMEYLPAIKGTTVYRESSRGVSPLTPISLETALARKYESRGEVDCSSGTCSI
jgi:ribonucleoside-diphosphate reductase alpha chain